MKQGILSLLIFAFSGCAFLSKEPGRPPKIDGVPVPDSKRMIYIQNVRNNTYSPGMHTRLTQMIMEEIDRRGRFITTREKTLAKYRLYAEIVHYQQVGDLMDLADRQITSELFVVTRVEIIEAETGNKIPMERSEIPGRVHFSTQIGFRESELEAQNRLLRVMALRIAEESERAWYYSLSGNLN
ncbi:LPS assembly lipoprotein LptE [Leptospira sp. 2 VSF19]|uniref:LPS assembly lipoprotein LptE n=1 Tax=Leptospira soteropolitanensis TaxID=2950025 RepID=A0AAW5VNZ1_9LEPT|nr:LPS assembly lipoprotein LptE [Leptospira soteropolitanensis]MCW7493740.1 LPS assembly lipoprotein LptE [Leptospira soteropolitanensis]MCW7501338.1 LPS assembly lipoprotein LptE [Leptospira soteropolitanensis]MCW7523476.1 LPS assembly lipoprotein LptE [Leptospira soteropolitanensis]MCW7527452.1 LPS assembly lipoprotein LptE [Leptospira soteropolitanensis]MCW7531308.1 LPS assembly lipoprotein LptE [Leptospira soteropolitanensis]